MITAKYPENWRSLQEETAQVLRECGFSVEIEKKITTVRGVVEIDVYAEENVRGRLYKIFCECKYWSVKIPQQVIHGFRTVVADAGANAGYIVSSMGFQTGAFSAAELTNTRLVTWEQFQEEFEESWLKHYLYPTVAEQFDSLLTYTEPLLPVEFQDLNADEKANFIALKDKHDMFGWLMMRFTPYMQYFTPKPPPILPLRQCLANTEWLKAVPEAILDITGYRQFLEAAKLHSNAAVAEFRTALKK